MMIIIKAITMNDYHFMLEIINTPILPIQCLYLLWTVGSTAITLVAVYLNGRRSTASGR